MFWTWDFRSHLRFYGPWLISAEWQSLGILWLHCGQEHFMGLPLWSWGRLPSGLGKAGAGVEAFSQELWGGSRGKSPPRICGFALDSCSPSPVALELCSFLHNLEPGPKQPWGQLESPWWLISSWRGDPEGSDPVPSCRNLQLHFHVKLLKGCGLPNCWCQTNNSAWAGASMETWFPVVPPASSSLVQPWLLGELVVGLPPCARANSLPVPALLSLETVAASVTTRLSCFFAQAV